MTRTSYLKFLSVALNKYREIDHRFPGQGNEDLPGFNRAVRAQPSRIIVRKGLEFIALKTDDIAMVCMENRIVYVVDKKGRKYFSEKNIGEMEALLDQALFFRMNRQHLVNVNFIKAFRPYEKVKLLVDLEVPGMEKEIVISQENAVQFRQWIYQV
jgi:DNA-binding LytR/AlgR family response regulator